MIRTVIIYFLFLLSFTAGASETNPYVQFEWRDLAEIPPPQGASVQAGLVGAFTGIHNDALLVAGGANFPGASVLEGGKKVYHSDIYILEKKEDGSYTWYQDKRFSLTERVAYGLTVGTDRGLVCIGGQNATDNLASVFRLKWNATSKEISREPLPPLPVPLANMSGGLIGSKIYVSASEGDQKHFLFLDLNDEAAGWQTLPVWEGSARTHSVGVVQHNGEEDCFYLFKGRFKGQQQTSTLLSDSWVYQPSSKEWKRVNTPMGSADFPLSAGTGIAVGANHVLLFGGDDGKVFNRLEQLGYDISTTPDTAQRNILMAERSSLIGNHQGFSKRIWAFHTITQTWAELGELPTRPQVTTTALQWGDQIVIPSGEVSPGVRTPTIASVKLTNRTSFGVLNYLVLLVYLIVLIAIGLLFSRNQHSTDDFFKGGNRIPWWAAGLSIFGTQLSAITFMAIPAKTFATDWLYFFLMMTIIMVSPFIIRFFLPFYRRFNLTTAYEYLELRFNLLTRLLGSSMYIFLQLGRLGIVLLLPSIALSVVTSIDVQLCIIVMGVLSILYTVMGGIEAVIWTDVVQVIVLLGGALLSLIFLYLNLDGDNISTYVSEFEKMRVFDFELSFSEPTLWVVLIGGFASNIVQYGSDQTVIQRYLTTKDEKSAARGITIGAWLALPSALIFFLLGTLLFVYYRASPEQLNPILEKTDAIFPWYIVNSLPQGVSGLLIAAVFAASMSSLDSSMNSVSTVITTDFFRRLRPLANEAAYLNTARGITIGIGLLGTGLALIMSTWGISSLWDHFNLIVGLFTGGLGGVFVLGIFSKRATGTGALIGLLFSGAFQYLIKEYTDIHLLMYAFTGMISCIVIGYLASFYPTTESADKKQFTYGNLKKQSSI